MDSRRWRSSVCRSHYDDWEGRPTPHGPIRRCNKRISSNCSYLGEFVLFILRSKVDGTCLIMNMISLFPCNSQLVSSGSVSGERQWVNEVDKC